MSKLDHAPGNLGLQPEPIDFLIDPGSATLEDTAKFYTELSKFYEKTGSRPPTNDAMVS